MGLIPQKSLEVARSDTAFAAQNVKAMKGGTSNFPRKYTNYRSLSKLFHGMGQRPWKESQHWI